MKDLCRHHVTAAEDFRRPPQQKKLSKDIKISDDCFMVNMYIFFIVYPHGQFTEKWFSTCNWVQFGSPDSETTESRWWSHDLILVVAHGRTGLYRST